MGNWLYLTLIVFTILVPLIRSFEPRISFYNNWKALFPAVSVVGVAFILWDMKFTEMGVWGFNPEYLTGIYISNLPLEECLFFVVIPYSSIFVFEVFEYFFTRDLSLSTNRSLALIIGVANLIVAYLFSDQAYTFYSQLLCGLVLISIALLAPNMLKGFWRMFAIILIGFFLVNGFLTGSWIEGEVVWYSSSEIIGIRLGTIPVEDTFYGLSLILANLFFYKIFKKRLRIA